MRISLRHILPILLIAALSACNRSDQEYNKGVAVSAVFSDSEDSTTEPDDLQLWFYNASNGQLIFSSPYENSRELALKVFPLPKGDYTAVIGANLSSPLSIEGDNSRQELCYLLDGISPMQAFSASKDFTIDTPTKVIEVRMEVQRFLCELAIEIEGAPDGLGLEVESINTAEAFHPAQKGEDGSYGIPSRSPKPCAIPSFSLSAASPRSESFILMPTALGREWSLWRIVMRTPDGKILESIVEAPRMNPGGKYLISLEYADIQSFMHLSPCTIEDWTQGWVYNGEITDPTTNE